MEKDYPHNIAQTFDADFQPMYALNEAQYQRTINQLANLVIDTIKQLHQRDTLDLAHQITEHASNILCLYDDDVVDYIQRTAWRAEHQPRIIGDSREVLLR